jgi:pimeloyl-ACP methyl ester carboxylesterase
VRSVVESGSAAYSNTTAAPHEYFYHTGSGWESVYTMLKKQGYNVAIVQNPTISLADDVAVTKRVIAAQDGPVVLVGHSYDGAVITEAGNDPKVARLVYITAFAPDKNESVQTLISNPAPGAPVPPILPPLDGFLLLDSAKFAASLAGDVNPDMAAFMADSQVPWGFDALGGKRTGTRLGADENGWKRSVRRHRAGSSNSGVARYRRRRASHRSVLLPHGAACAEPASRRHEPSGPPDRRVRKSIVDRPSQLANAIVFTYWLNPSLSLIAEQLGPSQPEPR